MCARGSRGGGLGGANFVNLSQAQTCNRDRQLAISSVSGLAALHSSRYRLQSTADPQLYCPHSAKSLSRGRYIRQQSVDVLSRIKYPPSKCNMYCPLLGKLNAQQFHAQLTIIMLLGPRNHKPLHGKPSCNATSCSVIVHSPCGKWKVAPSRLAPFGPFPSAFCVFEVSPSASDYPDSALNTVNVRRDGCVHKCTGREHVLARVMFGLEYAAITVSIRQNNLACPPLLIPETDIWLLNLEYSALKVILSDMQTRC
ncbi:Serine/threonine protein phosphatase 7 long form isogeny [Senna tora]|uniref:Serine/threonine protein phosphatase 7 long form isogeny n=1 Tax=Senna tora TaxID=362788 RepID=A0A834SE66_9FABA|nr:Serine/threonine protein phosphatase 7 long form isogeny [Senna tora]